MMDQELLQGLGDSVGFFDGQRLTAADLSAAQAEHQALRWLHNRTLHDWGLVVGLSVHAEKGDREVTIHPGYALDSLGREIILRDMARLPIPPIAGRGDSETDFFLTIAFPDREDIVPRETREGLCAAEGVVRLGAEPVFAWTANPNLTSGRELVLGQLFIRNCQLSRPASPTGRRAARPAQQPYLAAGKTLPQDTSWRFLYPDNSGSPIGVATTVDTSAGRFQQTPHYLAQLGGTRVYSSQGRVTVFDGFVHVSNATRNSFDLQVVMPSGLPVGKNASLNGILHGNTALMPLLRKQLQWHVSWIGIEA
ncbi:MAG: hypothetical protein ACK6D3_07835 [Planctomycetaceae bacterium]